MSQALRIGDPDRADTDSETNDDGFEVPMAEADRNGCEYCNNVSNMCSARFLLVRGSAHAWAVRSVQMGSSDRLRSGVLRAQCLAECKISHPVSSVEAMLRAERARFSMLVAVVLHRCVVML